MESGIVNFEFGSLPVRVVDVEGEPWFVAADIATVLEFRDAANAVRGLDEDERGTHILSTPGGTQDMTIINEPGLYSLIMRSRKPEAKAFKRWVTHEVLPSIRRTGMYAMDPTNAEQADILAVALKIQSDRLSAMESSNRVLYAKTQEQNETIAALAPMAQHAERILDSDSLVASTVIAKQLGTSAVKLHAFLHRSNVIYRKCGTWHLYAKYMTQGLARVVTHRFTHSDGRAGTNDTLKWTEAGRLLIHQLWSDAHVPDSTLEG